VTSIIGIEIKVEEDSKQIIHAGKVASGPVMLEKYINKLKIQTETVVTHRCVAIVDGPVEADKAQALLVFPEAGPGGSTVWALQLSHSTAVCPEGHVLLHLWCTGNSNGEENELPEKYLMPCLESLADCSQEKKEQQHAATGDDADDGKVQQGRPHALFAACFSLKALKPISKRPGNVVLCTGPSADVTFATAVEDAKTCYWQLFPAPLSADGVAAEEDAEGETVLPFPLDEAVVRAQEAANSAEQQKEDGDGGGGTVDVDSDDEALQALKAALELLPSTETTSTE
jgi:hypothetical protein